MLNILRRLPTAIAEPIARSRLFGSVGACFLSYEVATLTEEPHPNREQIAIATRNIRDNFNLLTGVDTCGACRIGELMSRGIHGIKIVGRENLTPKKIQDTLLLKRACDYFRTNDPRSGYAIHQPRIMQIYREVYGFDCGKLVLLSRLKIESGGHVEQAAFIWQLKDWKCSAQGCRPALFRSLNSVND